MPADDAGRAATSPTAVPDLLTETRRQLTVCNSCRYCEGLCAVFPALERRSVLDGGDLTQLANLCHDCRACFDACMYSPPHEFQLNIPQTLAAVRVADYQRLVWPKRVPSLLAGWTGVFAGCVVAVAVFLIAAVAHTGLPGLVRDPSSAASPYNLIPYPVLLVLMLAPAVFAVVVMLGAARAYWRETGPGPRVSATSVTRALCYAATLRYLRGGGGDCYYPEDDRPSGARRHLHGLVAYGFVLCLVSTISAAILQDIAGQQPPYPLVSVPVLTGVVGGMAMAVGCAGLLQLKAQASPELGLRAMTVKDYGFLVALLFLSVTGLATLLVRNTAAYGPVLLVHLSAIAVCFAASPYSKFTHLEYRFLALVRDAAEGIGPSSPNHK